MIIAIDGPAGSGKSSTVKAVAARLGITYLDTGAMYRVITLKCLRLGIKASNDVGLAKVVQSTKIRFQGVPPSMQVFMDGEDVTEAVRSDSVTKQVSDYCTPTVVRTALVGQQRRIAAGQSVVCEGRDIGTVVFPEADIKLFMTASVEERANRRQKDFAKMGVTKSIDELVEEISIRDHKDSTRKNSPLCKADDAEEFDTTDVTLEEQVDYIVGKVAALNK